MISGSMGQLILKERAVDSIELAKKGVRLISHGCTYAIGDTGAPGVELENKFSVTALALQL